MPTLTRRIKFVLEMPLTATADTDADGQVLREMLAHAAVRALAERPPREIAAHILVVEDVLSTLISPPNEAQASAFI